MMPVPRLALAGMVLAVLPCIALGRTSGPTGDPNLPLADGSTPLAWAIERQDGDGVRQLLARGAKPDNPTHPSVAPLIIACQYGDPLILGLLLDARADVGAALADGLTPLALCAGSAPAGILGRMIAAGAAVDRADERGQTPLMWAAARARIDNIHLLVDRGAAINRRTAQGFTPLFFALKSGDAQAPVVVLAAGGDPDYVGPDGTSVVQLAMYQQQYAFAARMIERGVNLAAYDRQGNQLLHAAVRANQPGLVKLLLAKGADPNALTGPPRVKWRFERNFKSGDYEEPRKSALLIAAEQGSADLMKLLVAAGAAPGFRAADGSNIVLAAATSGRPAALAFALALEPDPNTTTRDGETPLHLLLENGSGAEGAGPESVAMMQLLADRGARIDIKNHDGKTAADVGEDGQFSGRTAFEAIFRHAGAPRP